MRTVAVVCVIAASALTGPPVWAGLVGDQYQHDPYLVHDQWQVDCDFSYGVGASTKMAQTFTAGQTGVLDHIDIGNLTGVSYEPVSPPVEIRIYEGLRDLDSDSQPLASVTLSRPLLLDDWTLCIEPVNSSSQKISVNAGTMYSIVLWGNVASVGATTDDSYYDSGEPGKGAGALWAWGIWEVGGEERWGLLGDTGVYDMQFQTYVVPVPLPAGVWLGIFAVSVAGWHLKRQMA